MATERFLEQLLVWMGRMSWQASVLVLLVLITQCIFHARLTPRWRHALWWLVLMRLILPVAPETGFSVFNLTRGRTPEARSAFIYEGSSRFDKDPGPSLPRVLPTTPSDTPPVATQAIADQTVPATPTNVSPSSISAPPQSTKSFVLWVLVGTWGLGIVLMLGRVIWGNLGFARRVSRRDPIVDPALLQLLDECRRVIGISQSPAVIETPEVDSPVLFGCFRVKLLLPPGLAGTFTRAEMRHVFLHELAHIRRWDVPTNWLMTLIQIAHWFNPVIWLALSRMRADRELACDALALSLVQDDESQPYGQTIIKFLEGFVHPTAVPGLVGILEEKAQMKRRIHMIAKFKRTSRWSALAVVLFVGLGLVTLTDARNKSEIQKPSDSGTDTSTSRGDDIVDPNTGLKFTVAKRISAENDKIVHNNRLRLSPNGKFLFYRGWMTPLDSGKTFLLAGDMGGDRGYAAWSPDGKLIAYRRGLAIWLQPVSPETGQSAGPARKLIDYPANWWGGWILWSADSQWVMLYYFDRGYHPIIEKCVSVRDGRLIQPPDYTHFSLLSPDQRTLAYFKPDSVWTMPAKGGASRLAVGTGGFVGRSTMPLWWSPDGEWLLCGESWRGYEYDNLIFVRLADRREVALKFPEKVENKGFPAIGLGVSSDTRKLQFFKNAYNLRLVSKVAPIRGGGFAEPPFLQQFDYAEMCEVHAPEYQGLVFMGYKSRNWALYVAQADGGDPAEVKLDTSLGSGLVPSIVSPDGKKLLVRKVRRQVSERLNDLYVVPISLQKAQSTGPATLVFRDWQNPPAGGIAWSPDSSSLVICDKGQGDGDLWVVPADGSEPKQLTQTPEEVEQSPTWSPDGKYIAYCVNANAAAGVGVNLFAIPAEGGAPKRLWTWATPTGRGAQRHTWFPDSKEIGVASDHGVVAVALADAGVRPFLKDTDAHLTWIWWLEWSPDGQALAFFGGDDDALQTALFRASDQKAELLPHDPGPSWIEDLGWTGETLFCLAEQPERIMPAALIYEVDLLEAWAQAKKSVAVEPPPAGTSPIFKLKALPLTNGEFHDDFESSAIKSWTLQNEAEGLDHLCEIQNGELALENSRATVGLSEWTDYIVTVKMCVKQAGAAPTKGVFAGIGFHSGENAEYCLSAVPALKDLWLGIRYQGSEGRYRTGTLAESPYNFVLDKWYTIQVEVKGPHLVVRVDGQSYIDVNDENCPRGAVALIAGAGTRVHFDDFSVRLLR